MTMTDPIADMLTRIRNANTAHFETVRMPGSKLKESLAAILVDEGYISGYQVDDAAGQARQDPRDHHEVFARPRADHLGDQADQQAGLRIYTRADRIPRVLGGLGVAVVSTSKGLMTDREARRRHIGGEVLCYVWWPCAEPSRARSGWREPLMSRIGRSPIEVPSGVDVALGEDNHVTVKGPQGELARSVPSAITVRQEGDVLVVERPDDQRQNRALHGLTRSLVANMVVGVTQGFSKELEIVVSATGPSRRVPRPSSSRSASPTRWRWTRPRA